VNLLKASIDESVCIQQFGSKADSICNSALEKFSSEAPLPDDDKNKEAVYDKKVCFLVQTL
jgi:hypothetical protein